MFWADHTNKLAGVTLLLLAALAIAGVAVLDTVALADADPMARDDIQEMMRDIDDNNALFIVGLAIDHASSAVLLLAAPMLYLVFRNRSRPLALFAFVGFFAAGVAFLAADTASMTVGLLAADFVEEGGAGGIAAGDPVILQSARAVAAFSGMADLAGLTPFALGLLALGSLLAWAPEGEANPPRWLGGLAILSGLATLLGWIVLAAEAAGIVFSGIGIIATLLLLVVLGGWLVIQPERRTEPAQPRPAVGNA